MRKNLKAIIFDLGGVLYDIDIQLSVKYFERLGFNNFDHLFSLKEQIGLFDLWEKGLIDEKSFIEEIRKIAGLPLIDTQIVEGWNELLIGMTADTIALLKELRRDYPIYLLSNTNMLHLEYIDREVQEQFGLEKLSELFDKAFYSYEMGKRKPDADIYEQVISETGLASEEMIFIDDNLDNLKAAAATGLQTFWKDRNISLKEALANEEWFSKYLV
jgi:putative hydrolase of the HAD superfamily